MRYRKLPDAVVQQRALEYKVDLDLMVARGQMELARTDAELEEQARRLARDDDISLYYKVADNWKQFRHGEVEIGYALAWM